MLDLTGDRSSVNHPHRVSMDAMFQKKSLQRKRKGLICADSKVLMIMIRTHGCCSANVSADRLLIATIARIITWSLFQPETDWSKKLWAFGSFHFFTYLKAENSFHLTHWVIPRRRKWNNPHCCAKLNPLSVQLNLIDLDRFNCKCTSYIVVQQNWYTSEWANDLGAPVF